MRGLLGEGSFGLRILPTLPAAAAGRGGGGSGGRVEGVGLSSSPLPTVLTAPHLNAAAAPPASTGSAYGVFFQI